MKKTIIAIAASVLAVPASAQGDATPEQPLPVAADAKPAKPKLICRSIERTGSRIASDRICATREEWERRAFNDQAFTDRMARTTPFAE